MKKLVLSIVTCTLLFTGFSYAQTSINLPSDYLQNNSSGKNVIPDNVQGSPYYLDTFSYGKVYVNNDNPYSTSLRYNAYSDEIEMQDQGKTISLLKRKYIKAEINGKQFAIKEYLLNNNKREGYFVTLNEGNTSLLLRQTKTLLEAEKADSSYKADKPARFVDKTAYYLSVDNAPAVAVRLKKKDILKKLSHKKEVEQYIADNSLKLKKEAEIVQLLAYYNTL